MPKQFKVYVGDEDDDIGRDRRGNYCIEVNGEGLLNLGNTGRSSMPLLRFTSREEAQAFCDRYNT